MTADGHRLAMLSFLAVGAAHKATHWVDLVGLAAPIELLAVRLAHPVLAVPGTSPTFLEVAVLAPDRPAQLQGEVAALLWCMSC